MKLYKKIILITFISQLVMASINNFALGLPKQTQIQNAQTEFDQNGIPIMHIEGIGAQRNPATIAAYALAYGGRHEGYYKLDCSKNTKKFEASLQWLVNNMVKTKGGLWVWQYDFDHTYNDITVKRPWYSAFGQATGIEALLAGYKEFNDKSYLESAIKAAKVIITPIQEGGLMFTNGNDVWFEELVDSNGKPTYILNGHMRALIALHELATVTGDNCYKEHFNKGVTTLIKWLPKYDTGYWLRYDLNPRKTELLFRFNNPYGDLPDLAIHKIVLRDPLTNEEKVLNIGARGDTEGSMKISGNGWGQQIEIDGKSTRRLIKVTPSTYTEQLDGDPHHAPYTYFYLDLPSNWQDNLRSEWFELVVTYKDELPGNVAVQMRSIAPGPAFQWARNGELLLTGSGKWREWTIPIRISDLGFPCGEIYGEKHLQYLEKLASWEPKLRDWVSLMQGYLYSFDDNHYTKEVKLIKQVLPYQSFMLPLISIDDKGVLQQHVVSKESVIDGDGLWDFKSDFGEQVYQLYIISLQAEHGYKALEGSLHKSHDTLKQNKFIKKKQINFISKENVSKLKREPAYEYLLNHAVAKGSEALLWESGYPNTYNDVVIDENWSSSFTQAYVIKALKAAINDNIKTPAADYSKILSKALMGYFVPVEENGFMFNSHYSLPFFQEFSKLPPHNIINAHLVSLTTIKDSIDYEPRLKHLYELGLKTLKEHIHLFDAGYWLRYDLNPKKETLVQIDWLGGKLSPLIEAIEIENPQTANFTKIEVAEDSTYKSYPNIAGADWSTVQSDETKRKGRSFVNGYLLRSKPLNKGALHNVYFTMVLPDREFNNNFIIPVFKMKIKYKDIAPGKFHFKIKPINLNDFYNFIPLKDGHITCNGDQVWKEAIIPIYPEELGWFVGPDYQKFHTEQLELIGEQNNDWFFKQLGERHKYFYDSPYCLIKNN